jgi:hypothetical protein
VALVYSDSVFEAVAAIDHPSALAVFAASCAEAADAVECLSTWLWLATMLPSAQWSNLPDAPGSWTEATKPSSTWSPETGTGTWTEEAEKPASWDANRPC